MVDLPASRKGSDLSRNAELLAEVVDQTSSRPASSLEDVCTSIARQLLARHPSARTSTVQSSAEYFRRRGLRPGARSFEDYRILASARAVRRGRRIETARGIGAEAVGMTACPCAMETCRRALQAEFPALRDPRLAAMPIVTHNQRNRTRLVIELTQDGAVEVDDLIELIEDAQSSPTYAILKRGDEGRVVLDAHRSPRFVEDVVRGVLGRVVQRFPQLPDDAIATVESISEESIHKYDVRASARVRLGRLRAGR